MRRAGLRLVFVVATVSLAAGYPAVSQGASAISERAARVVGPGDVSSNWAGYVATGPGSSSTTASPAMAYTDVTGQWVEPTATCTGEPTSVAVWVGLGGYSVSSSKLEQTGTSADCSRNGTPSYYAWYELVPANSVNIRLRIFPGDVIASSVVVDGDDVLVQVTDRTRHTRFTRHLTMAAPDLTSAEWIAEAPAECSSASACQQFALTDFNTVNFSRTFAIGNELPGTISSPNWMATAMQLVPSSHRFFGDAYNSRSGGPGAGATPLALAPDGSGFTVDWQASATSGQ